MKRTLDRYLTYVTNYIKEHKTIGVYSFKTQTCFHPKNIRVYSNSIYWVKLLLLKLLNLFDFIIFFAWRVYHSYHDISFKKSSFCFSVDVDFHKRFLSSFCDVFVSYDRKQKLL